MTQFKQPTSEQCTHNAIIYEDDSEIAVAAWHPQWGGYCGRCLIIFTKGEGTEGCFRVINWHDGCFPISDDDALNATDYHYCDAQQLVNFGQLVQTLQKTYAKG